MKLFECIFDYISEQLFNFYQNCVFCEAPGNKSEKHNEKKTNPKCNNLPKLSSWTFREFPRLPLLMEVMMV